MSVNCLLLKSRFHEGNKKKSQETISAAFSQTAGTILDSLSGLNGWFLSVRPLWYEKINRLASSPHSISPDKIVLGDGGGDFHFNLMVFLHETTDLRTNIRLKWSEKLKKTFSCPNLYQNMLYDAPSQLSSSMSFIPRWYWSMSSRFRIIERAFGRE